MSYISYYLRLIRVIISSRIFSSLEVINKNVYEVVNETFTLYIT